MKNFAVKKLKSQRGAAIVETMFAMIVLLLIFFGLVQIIIWASSKMLCEYASYHVAKGRSLGYTNNIITKAGRVASMGSSGRDISEKPLPRNASAYEVGLRSEDYMRYERFGNYGVNYEFWENNSPAGKLLISHSGDSNSASGRVAINGMGLLHPGIKYFVAGTTEADIPSGESVRRNYSVEYINE